MGVVPRVYGNEKPYFLEASYHTLNLALVAWSDLIMNGSNNRDYGISFDNQQIPNPKLG
jgi:hypothetical protein